MPFGFFSLFDDVMQNGVLASKQMRFMFETNILQSKRFLYQWQTIAHGTLMPSIFAYNISQKTVNCKG
jgi:hypothetical protein